jgi:hypothetical protein
MFSIALTLAITSFIFEMMLAANFKWWRELAHANKLFNMLASVLLSAALGFIFNAGGLTALTAGMLSTAMSIPGYAMLKWNFDSEKAVAKGGNRYAHIKKSAKPKIEKGKELGSDLVKLGYITGKVITSPIWITNKAVKFYKKHKSS